MIDARCRSDKDCTRWTTDGAGLVTQPGSLCHGCIEAIQKCYDELPHLAAALNTLKGTWGGVSYEARVSGSKEPPTPLHVGIVDLIDEVWDVIDRSSGYRVIDLVTQPAEEWVIGGRRVVRNGVDRALDIRRVHSKAENRVGFNRVWQRRAAACPTCAMQTLGQWLGDDNILCTNEDCLAAFSKTAYEDHCFSDMQRQQKGKKANA